MNTVRRRDRERERERERVNTKTLLENNTQSVYIVWMRSSTSLADPADVELVSQQLITSTLNCPF